MMSRRGRLNNIKIRINNDKLRTEVELGNTNKEK